MDEMYGIHHHSSADYSDHPPPLLSSDHLFPPHHHLSPPRFRDRIPIIGSGHFFSTSSVSDCNASMHRVGSGEEITSAIRAKIAAHPLYPKLLEAYINCQKVGAPPEITDLLDEIRKESELCRRTDASTCFGSDPELDEFMETYCDILVKYKSDLARPFNEATTFLKDIEIQLNNLCKPPSRTHISDDTAAGSSEEDVSGGEIEPEECHRTAEDRELKDKLLRKYSGYISSLKHEFSKKKKKGKLPREARQTLLDWWNIHYKWPYPTEADKAALAETTGLDQKQINNWFINQRKRHWKPSENMQFAVMDSIYGPFYVDD